MRLRYRPFQAVAIATLAALITACAAFAPLYDRAMRQALTDISIARTPASVAGLQMTGTTQLGGFTFATHNDTDPPTPEVVAAKLPEDLRDAYADPVLGYSALVISEPGRSSDPRGQLIWRAGQCEHVTMVEGSCPDATGEIAISEADVENFGLGVGDTVRVAGIPRDLARRTVVPSVPLVVTGIYEQQRDDYWFGLNLTGLSGAVDSTPPPHVQHDIWLTERGTFDSSEVPPLPSQASTVGYPLDPAAVGVDDVLALGSEIEHLKDDARRDPANGVSVEVYSGLPDIADEIREQTEQSRVTVPLLMAQLGLLAVVVLWLVLLAVTEQRRPEVALARLRGRGRQGARRLLLGELLPVTLAGVVPGVLLAVGGVALARTSVLPGEAPFELGVPLLAAVGLAAAVLTAVTVLAVLRVSREPVETLLRRVPPRPAGFALGVAEALVIAGAGSVVVLFATGGLDGPIALAAPGLLAIVVGMVLAHLTTPTAAIAGRRMLRNGKVRAGVSFLDAARSPATRRIVAIVTLASALAVFSADALLVGDRNRASASEQGAGAALVVDVVGPDLAAVRTALTEVDPDGERVTPVVRLVPPGKDASGTLAVVPSQFQHVALFPGGAPDPALWERIAVPDAQPIELTGSSLAVDIDDATLRSERLDGEPHPVQLGLEVVNERGETLQVLLGELDGPADHTHVEVPVGCREGCYVTGVWLRTLPGATIDGSATFRNLVGLSDTGTEPVALGPAYLWAGLDDPVDGTVSPSSEDPEQLTIEVHGEGASQLTMSQVWLPGTVPALVAGELPPGSDDNGFSLVNIDGEVSDAARVATLERVPASPPDTAVVNLDLVERGSAITSSAVIELWFAEDDEALLAEVTEALDRQGVDVSGTTTLAGVRQEYDESTAAWSLQLAALIGAAALVIALLVLVVSAASSWRFRTRDLAALRMSGVPSRSIGAMAVAAQLPAVVVGVVAGAVAGLVGAHLALPIVPLFAEAPEVSTLDLGTAWVGVVVATVGALVVLGLGSVLIGRALARRSDIRRLRETL
ncbi:FtsX-like permease family protein [Nocardioides caricicola]|uniref:FtsX-like permease family protein n=1 Tax=Nocardioides caricicola TaxID=634770 RepID=A0ABW0N0W6_9ACTN